MTKNIHSRHCEYRGRINPAQRRSNFNNAKKCFWLVIIATVICFGFYVVKAQEPKPLLHFVQVSDTHLQRNFAKDAERLLGSSEKLLTDAVKQINDIQDLDFVLSTGDQVDVPDEKLIDKYIDITMSLNRPLYVLLGNHDVSVNGGLGKKGYIKKFYKLKDATSFTDEMAYYSFSPNDKFTVICLDGTTEKTVTANAQIANEQLKWLKSELEANKDKYIIIALHFPLIEPYKSESHQFLEPSRTKLLNLLSDYKNVVGIFSGHYHAARLFKIKNKIHNSCPAVVQYPNAFREITITQEDPKYLTFNFKFHAVDGAELREVSKNSSRSWSLSQGNDEDREQTIKLMVY